MSAAPEFSRIVAIDTLGGAARALELTADAAERAALAKRFDLVAIDRLTATLALARSDDAITASGKISAAVTQSCVVTADPVPARVDEDVNILFRPEPEAGPDEEIELSADDCDTIFYDGGAIDLGEAVAQTLLLALDPWPRSAQADAVLKAEGVRSEAEAEIDAKAASNPFAALRKT